VLSLTVSCLVVAGIETHLAVVENGEDIFPKYILWSFDVHLLQTEINFFDYSVLPILYDILWQKLELIFADVKQLTNLLWRKVKVKGKVVPVL
jgi:hypothetical protein